MSDQPQYRSTDPPTRQTMPYGAHGEWRQSDVVQMVRLDRPIYTGMMVGFGLMIASILFVVIMSVVFGILGILFGGALVSLTAAI